MADNDTFTREISGRTITFHPPTDAQFLVIGRLVRRASSLTSEEEDVVKVSGSIQELSKVLDILDSMVVDPADRDWLEERIVAGDLDLEALFGTFREQEPTNRATKRATKKATSSRARTK